ncbi:Low temperature viability protein-domain-containing protein [Mrakia frigida]|uniref:ribosome biogenesis protein LTV1 n=1 Tax=Mrakia frigida TaxID=29902 RepID=UPI003FCBEFA1
MAPKSKSLFRQPGVQHYQLVHRSQRDPLINDPDAGGRVLKSLENPNRKGKTRAEIAPAPEEGQPRPNEGEAALYEIFYDDTEYDYMQHLRGVGDGGADSVLLSAPEPKAPKPSSSGFTERPQPSSCSSSSTPFQLPSSALPSTSELPLAQAYSRLNASLPLELQGLQPDMDPHLRQVLEALEDDAFVGDDQGDDDEDGGWLGELVETGEVENMGEVEEYEFAEWGIENGRPVSREEEEEGMSEGEKEEREESWQERFKAFKKSEGKLRAEAEGGSDDGEEEEGTQRGGAKGKASGSGWGSEGGDTLSGLPALSVIGGKRRRKGAQSDASGYSMSSSSMFRNKGLSTLDEKFDRIEKIYEESESSNSNSDDEDASDQEYDSDGKPIPSGSGDAAPTLVTREDFDNLLDDFLDNFEIVGNKLKPVMEGDGPMGKLTSLRKGLEGDGGDGGEGERLRILELNRVEEERGYDEESDDEKLPMPELVGAEKERGWDCESILSTYSTLENHPRLIDERIRVPKILLDPKTGFPIVGEQPRRARGKKGRRGEILPAFDEEEEEEEELDEDGEPIPKQGTLIRPKDETPAEKKARKAAVKEERQSRRAQKKSTKDLFTKERNQQMNQHRGMVAEGRASDLSVAVDRQKVGIVKLV